MSQATDYLENRLIDHLFRGTTFTKPAALYIALFTSAPSDADVGMEVTGAGYARGAMASIDATGKATPGGVAGASSGSSGQTSNAIEIGFPIPTASWGTVVAMGVYDTSTGGNLLVWAMLASGRQILNGDPGPIFSVDALTITIA
jgi:hypothetical protein